ncbi:MAG: phosphotransferase family protein [Rhodospirillales bacterium]|nr:MAG: phosphotransferase family protein [Rhodospirillales bacterium]
MPDPTAASPGRDAAALVPALTTVCARYFGAPCAVEGLFRHSGGASRQTWGFDAVVGGARQKLVMRRDPPAPPGGKPSSPAENSLALDRGTEFEVMRAARAHGVPVPELLFQLRPGDGLGDGYVMRHVDGSAIARNLLREPRYAEARPRIVGQLGAILARLHAVPVAAAPPLGVSSPAHLLAGLRRVLDAIGEPHPVFELAITWLERRIPPTGAPRFVHGDFRTGNYLVDENGVSAILDWEIAHLGDPLEDLGWLCIKSWRFGAIDKPAGGFGTREELWAAYAAAGGDPVDPARARWWEIFGTVRWGVICINQAWKHLSGAEKSMELASIGRRAVETEVDLLQLLAEA